MPPLGKHIQLYCERTSEELWAEPINTLSSIGFLIAAWLLWRLYKQYRKDVGSAPEIPILIIITICIGAGSMIFHSVATIWAALFDIIPIGFFVFFYLYVFSRSLLGCNKAAAGAFFILLIAMNAVYKYYVFRAFDGYFSYLPTFLFLLALALFMLLKHHPSALRITFAAGVAFVSLYCRAADRESCYIIPFGTHFLWHLLNAWLIYILVRELMLSQMPRHGNA